MSTYILNVILRLSDKGGNNILSIILTLLDYALKILPIFISVSALYISIRNRGAAKREGKPNFRIVQNLWTQEPYFELINESNSKLDEPLNPTYIMLIPSKLFFVKKDGQRTSLMMLSPISYEVIIEQVVSGITKNQIVTSKLPPCFFGKKGDRDVIRTILPDQSSEELKMYVETYPFLVIMSAINYKYDKKSYTDIVLSTSFNNCNLEEKDFINLCMYTKDNFMHEVSVPEDGGSIYKKAHEQVCHAVKNMQNYPLFFGGREDGYGFVLKKINAMISPYDFLGEKFNTNCGS